MYMEKEMLEKLTSETIDMIVSDILSKIERVENNDDESIFVYGSIKVLLNDIKDLAIPK